MTKGPCLCGDPACHSCGNPGAVAWEAAIENLTDELNALGLDEYELELFKTVGIAALNAHREANKDRQAQIEAEQQAFVGFDRELCPRCGTPLGIGFIEYGNCPKCKG